MPYDDKPRFSPWDDRSLRNMYAPEEEARRTAAFIWIENRLAALLRELAPKASGAVGDALERQAGHHEWHASVWADHLRHGATGNGTSAPEGCDHLPELFDTIAQADDALEILAALTRVVEARLVAAYAFHRAAVGTDLGADGARWLDIILEDEHDARNELDLFLQSLLTSPADAERLGAWQARLESSLVRVGGLLGEGTLGGESLHVPSNVTPLRG